jgi:galactosylceramidase
LDGKDVFPHAHMGIGGVSAGATSRLLIDYDEPTRSLLFDLLFKPQFALSLSHLKVESPGSDADSTCGAEPSSMHSADDQPNAMRGYEGILLREARRRNPNMTLSMLQWGAPSWVAEGGNSLYTETDVDYVIAFVKALAQQANTSMDFISAGHNERALNGSYIKLMRRKLDAAGLNNVKVLAADTIGSAQELVNLMANDTELRGAVFAITTHVMGKIHGQSDPSPEVVNLGLPLIAAEEHIGLPDPNTVPMSNWSACRDWAVELSRNFIDDRQVGTWLWSLIFSWYDGVGYDGKGFFTANQPWSGAYKLPPFVYVTMQHSQFYHLGWQYLNASAVLPYPGVTGQYCFKGQRQNVCIDRALTFLALTSPDGADFSVVVETATVPADAEPYAMAFRLQGRLAQLWASKKLACRRTTESSLFEELVDVEVDSSGRFSIPLVGDSIVSVSSKRDQYDGTKSLPPIPAPAPFPLPYHEDFESYQNDTLPKYLSDFNGAFAVADTNSVSSAVEASDVSHDMGAGRVSGHKVSNKVSNKVLRQYVTASPLGWGHFAGPVTFIGDATWCAPMAVNVSVRTPGSSPSFVHGGSNNPAAVSAASNITGDRPVGVAGSTSFVAATLFWTRLASGPTLKLRPDNGSWAVECYNTSYHPTPSTITLLTGRLPHSGGAPSSGSSGWYRLSFGAFANSSLFGVVNGNVLFSGLEPAEACLKAGQALPAGFVALQTGLNLADFDDLVLWKPKGHAPHGKSRTAHQRTP